MKNKKKIMFLFLGLKKKFFVSLLTKEIVQETISFFRPYLVYLETWLNWLKQGILYKNEEIVSMDQL